MIIIIGYSDINLPRHWGKKPLKPLKLSQREGDGGGASNDDDVGLYHPRIEANQPQLESRER